MKILEKALYCWYFFRSCSNHVEFVIDVLSPADPDVDAEMGEEDSLSGWDEAGDPEEGDKFSSSGWDVADDVEELPSSG